VPFAAGYAATLASNRSGTHFGVRRYRPLGWAARGPRPNLFIPAGTFCPAQEWRPAGSPAAFLTPATLQPTVRVRMPYVVGYAYIQMWTARESTKTLKARPPARPALDLAG
jgi:hypothetical protein